MTTDSGPNDRLNSWKAIANHLGCSVRTARRWEASEGLPVHRHRHAAQATIFAYKSELDAWRVGTSLAPVTPASEQQKTSKPTIVILPFDYLGSDEQRRYVADGLGDDVLLDLAKLDELRVITRSSSVAMKRSDSFSGSAARSLGIDALVEGSVRETDDGYRVVVRLINARDESLRWAGDYDVAGDGLQRLPSEIAADIAKELDVELTRDTRQRMTQDTLPNAELWRLAQQARQSAYRWRKDGIDHALRLLESALQKAPDNVVLLSAAGRTWLQYREAGVDAGAEPLERAAEYSERVKRLKPDANPGQQLEGWLRYARGDAVAASRALERALEGDWNNADTAGLLINCYLITGRNALARPLIDHVRAIDPLTPLTRCLPGWAAILDGHAEQALGPYREMLDMDPGNPMARLFYTWVLAMNDCRSELEAQRDDGTQPAYDPATQVRRMLTEAALQRASAELPPLDDATRAAASSTDVFARLLADTYALNGNVAESAHWLGVAVDRGFINYPYLARSNPFLAPILDETPIAAVLAKAHRAWERAE